jgi:hypothetical protein
MQQRRHFKQTEMLKSHLIAFAKGVRDRAMEMRSGPERDALLKRARQANTAAHLDDWANSPGLQPPK